jgi:hypothetical protein
MVKIMLAMKASSRANAMPARGSISLGKYILVMRL